MHGLKRQLELLHSLTQFGEERNDWELTALRSDTFLASKNRVLQFPAKNHFYLTLDLHIMLLDGRAWAADSLLHYGLTITTKLINVRDVA